VQFFRKHAEEIVGVILNFAMFHMDGQETFQEFCHIREDVSVVLSSGFIQ
jgi:hypothetical protein